MGNRDDAQKYISDFEFERIHGVPNRIEYHLVERVVYLFKMSLSPSLSPSQNCKVSLHLVVSKSKPLYKRAVTLDNH